MCTSTFEGLPGSTTSRDRERWARLSENETEVRAVLNLFVLGRDLDRAVLRRRREVEPHGGPNRTEQQIAQPLPVLGGLSLLGTFN